MAGIEETVPERRARRAAAQEVFDALAVDYLGRPGVSSGPMFGSQGLRSDGKFFAFVGRAGDLVLKLPPEQAAALVAGGQATAVRAGRNATREWVSVPRSPGEGTARWSILLEDAYRYAGQSI
ncbi:MAG: TfoX/Sxy family protein [Chloroflexota bacterium]|nr:TfoX/Sxy family protein [Chloroflexota bacterium]